MIVQCIYTYNDRDQEMIDFKKFPKTALENERNFLVYVRGILNDAERLDLVKISACVFTDKEPPKWFMACMGKFYFKNNEKI